jgi:hypothetical protein
MLEERDDMLADAPRETLFDTLLDLSPSDLATPSERAVGSTRPRRLQLHLDTPAGELWHTITLTPSGSGTRVVQVLELDLPVSWRPMRSLARELLRRRVELVRRHIATIEPGALAPPAGEPANATTATEAPGR